MAPGGPEGRRAHISGDQGFDQLLNLDALDVQSQLTLNAVEVP